MQQEGSPRGTRYGRVVSRAIQFALLFGFWVGLSGRVAPLELILGALSAGLVTLLSHEFLFRGGVAEEVGETGAHRERLRLHRFLAYAPWIFLQIVLANVQVAHLVLHPRMPVDPVLVQFGTPLRGHPSQVLLAHSITLTPGTITIDAHEGRFLVHAITPGSAGLLLRGRMQQRVEEVFGVQGERPSEPLVTRSVKELHP